MNVEPQFSATLIAHVWANPKGRLCGASNCCVVLNAKWAVFLRPHCSARRAFIFSSSDWQILLYCTQFQTDHCLPFYSLDTLLRSE